MLYELIDTEAGFIEIKLEVTGCESLECAGLLNHDMVEYMLNRMILIKSESLKKLNLFSPCSNMIIGKFSSR